MKSFKDFLNENSKATALINNASMNAITKEHGKYSRMTKLGFELLSDSAISKETTLQHSFFSRRNGTPLGQIQLPTKVIQNEVSREYVISLLKSSSNLPPIKVVDYDGEYVVVDGHHRLAAAKALGKRTISAHLIAE